MKEHRKSMKVAKTIIIIALIVIIFSLTAGAQSYSFAETSQIRVYIDEEEMTFTDMKPYLSKNRVLVPVRLISEQLGATVEWDQSKRIVTIIKGNDVISFNIDYPRMTKNGTSYSMDAAAAMINGRVMVPLRFVSEQLGVGVTWEAETRSVLIDTSAENIPIITPSKQDVNKLILDMAKENPIYINGILVVNKSYPLPQDYNPGENATARKAFNIMQTSAKLEGINVYISSGFRSYSHQINTYNRYVKLYGQNVADTFAARPGYSEHQTGLAFDLNSIGDSFANTKEGIWVQNNCYKYGFIVRYPKGKESLTGYKYEPWHIRYVGIEVATDLYHKGLCLEEYLGITSTYQ